MSRTLPPCDCGHAFAEPLSYHLDTCALRKALEAEAAAAPTNLYREAFAAGRKAERERALACLRWHADDLSPEARTVLGFIVEEIEAESTNA